MILAAQALDGGRNQPETERPCVGGARPSGAGARTHRRASPAIPGILVGEAVAGEKPPATGTTNRYPAVVGPVTET